MTALLAPCATPSWTATPEATLQVNSVAFSDDGQCCVIGTSNEYSAGTFGVYCYDGAGALKWSLPFGDSGSTQGVFWVGVSADGQFAAAGGETATDAGLLTAYRVADGVQVLNIAPPKRVNQVALSGDGSLLLAVYDDTVQLYSYANGAYTLASQQVLSGAYCNSCALQPNGFQAIISCTIYHDEASAPGVAASSTPSTGQVVTLNITGGKLSVAGTWNSPVGSMRVAITASGNYWGASLHDGSCALFNAANVNQPLWQYKPSLANLGVAYGFAITETSAGRVVLACGANLYPPKPVPTPPPPGGYLYLVESVASGSTQAPQFCWGSDLQYSANPGVSLDREARQVTATDGQPASTTVESPGNFYLFDGASGAQVWSFATPVMNWPMTITPDGAHLFGGSDDGSVYYWSQTPA